jgi:phosphatidylglycerophosphate synthase
MTEAVPSNGKSVEEKKQPLDGTMRHAWIWEPRPHQNGVLTKDGIENIAEHKYVMGQYTMLDNFLSPIFGRMTEKFLPMWLAPNTVTTIGLLHCVVMYSVLWWHSPNFDQHVPDWVVLLSGYCIMAYYTFDCLDGKQARRTGAGSPLGQLFDHGVDCICNFMFISSIFALVMMSSQWALMLQCSLQFTFFMAQWEEYHTHILQHSVGGVFGVTEVNYGLGLFTIINSFLDRKALWRYPLQNILPFVPQHIHLGHAVISSTLVMLVTLVIGSLNRVGKYHKDLNRRMMAFGQLLTPASMLLAVVFLPKSVRDDHTRFVSLATGILFSLLTKKMIVFSMAKMTFAIIQLEAIPLLLVSLYIHYNATHDEFILQLLCVWYGYRLHKWAWLAVKQLCERLNIYCFSIKHLQQKKD